ncbi:MAG: hypothetical protein AAGE94_21935, partial [Acidobacteriota bacterium]
EHVTSLDRLIEDALLEVLADDPTERPSTALEVATLLPGGDPLAAALEAGETPSPEMVAAVPDRGVLAPPLAASAVLVLLLFLAAAHGLGRDTLLGLAPPTKSPAVLHDRAQQLLYELGRRDPIVDRVGAFRVAPPPDDLPSSPAAWRHYATRRPMPLTYWYRESPRSLLPWRVTWIVEPFDPPAVTGDALVVLDAYGRLQELRIEASNDRPNEAPATPDWAPLFRTAELDLDRFQTAAIDGPLVATDLPPHDQRWAWVREDSNEPLRVEVATLAGRIVYFSIGEGSPATSQAPDDTPVPSGRKLPLIATFTLLGAALVLATRHVRRGRADRRSAGVLGTTVAATSFLGLLAGAHHPPRHDELFLLLEIVEATAFRGAAVVLVYLALEPLIRRRAPEVLVTSTRLLTGRWRDPRVGRDLLVGILLGVGVAVAYGLAQQIPFLFDKPLAIYGLAQKLAGVGGSTYWMTFSFFMAVSGSLLLCLLYALLVAWWRRRWLAGLGLALVLVALTGFSPIGALASGLFAVSLVRFGLLATVATWIGIDWALFFPAGAAIDDWWWYLAILPSILLAIIATMAAWTATGRAKTARRRVWFGDSSARSTRSRSRASFPH